MRFARSTAPRELRFESLVASIEQARSASVELSLLFHRREQDLDKKRLQHETSERANTRYRSNPWTQRGTSPRKIRACIHQDRTRYCCGPILRRSMDMTLCWAVLGEKRILSAGFDRPYRPVLRMSGAYVLGESGLTGFVKRMFDERNGAPGSTQLVNIYRKL